MFETIQDHGVRFVMARNPVKVDVEGRINQPTLARKSLSGSAVSRGRG
jgi:hypothetical protein